MKIPVKWLSDYIELDRSLQDIASLLTLSGLEVESISSIGSLDEHILTARIVDLRAHPNAERLTLCSVETVPGDARQVVCGARNMKAGDVVVLATSGARLPDGTQIEQVKLRGQESHGMLCSERELGLGEGNEGIMILEPGTPLGIPFSRVSGRSDQVMELSITPNRSDCLSIQGVGRELAALTGTTFKKATLAPVSGGPLECPPRLTMEAPELCSMYHGRVLADVQVGPSPAWLVARLTAAGLRSINNVVDATNYILMDRGQPLHAFDLDRIEGRHIVVRQARSGERLMCLDGVERTLEPRDLVICDEARPVAIAGVMGGSHSAVNEQTRHLFLEAARFAPESVRATARRTGLHTDASHRFERGVDPEGVLPALDALSMLILSLAGGRVVGETLSVESTRPARPTIPMSPERVNALLGMQIPSERMRQHLLALQMTVELHGAEFQVVPPSYRLDIETEADLAEEVARMEGYEQIPTTLPLARMQSPNPGSRRRRVRELVEYLTSRGIDQVINYGFTSPHLIEALRLEGNDPRRQPIRLLNPLSEELSVMRTTLVAPLLKTAVYNVRHESPDLKVFEIGRVFLGNPSQERPRETFHLGVLLTGLRAARSWTDVPSSVDLFDLKGILEGIETHLRLPPFLLTADTAEPFLVPGQAWSVSLEGQRLGALGALHPEIGRAVGLEQSAYIMELDLEVLWTFVPAPLRFRPLPRFPAIQRDLAVLVDEKVTAGEVIELIRTSGSALLERVILFDVYRGRNIPDGKKSMAFGLSYRAEDRTLIESEVQEIYDGIVQRLELALSAQLRV